MILLDFIDLDKISTVRSLRKKKIWAIVESGRGFGLKFMRKSKLKKHKKNENDWIRWFLIFCILIVIFARHKKNPNIKFYFL